jgi:hypothetical protein
MSQRITLAEAIALGTGAAAAFTKALRTDGPRTQSPVSRRLAHEVDKWYEIALALSKERTPETS